MISNYDIFDELPGYLTEKDKRIKELEQDLDRQTTRANNEERMRLYYVQQCVANDVLISELKTALAKVEEVFRNYGDLHAVKQNMEKAKRNYELADEIRSKFFSEWSG